MKIFFLGQKVKSLNNGEYFAIIQTLRGGDKIQAVSFSTLYGHLKGKPPVDWEGTQEEAEAFFEPIHLSLDAV